MMQTGQSQLHQELILFRASIRAALPTATTLDITPAGITFSKLKRIISMNPGALSETWSSSSRSR